MKKLVIVCIIAFFAILTLCLSITVVDTGFTGVIVTGGAVSSNTFTAGFHFKVPLIQSVMQIDNRTQKIDVQGANAASKDLQTITTEIAVNYKVLQTASVDIYKNVGNSYKDTIIAPAIPEALKAVTAQYTAEQLVTERQAVSEKIKEALENKVKAYGILIEGINVQNFEFSPEFKAAVEAKQTAQQNALKAQQDLARIKIEAEQKVTQAKAEADSIKLIQETLTASPQYIEYMKWQKWNGVLPTVMAGSDGTIVDVGNVVK